MANGVLPAGYRVAGIGGMIVARMAMQRFFTRNTPESPRSDPDHAELTADFERELKRQADPRLSVAAIPWRFINWWA